MPDRIDSALRLIKASQQTIYQAYVDPAALALWLPPSGMQARIDEYDVRPGGRYRIVLTYEHPDHAVPGKTSEHTDVVHGLFIELVQDERIIQTVEFESDDPAFAGTMLMAWTFTAAGEGTNVVIRCTDVPHGIHAEDHEAGFRSTLKNLAAYTEA